jgi:hypothetical protein
LLDPKNDPAMFFTADRTRFSLTKPDCTHDIFVMIACEHL